MPARIVVVLDEPDFAGKVADVVRAAGHDAVALPSAMAALDALEGAFRIEVLVTCLDHGAGQPNGISLARMARTKKPGIKVLFLGDASRAHHADGLGAYLRAPVSIEQIVSHTIGMLEAGA